MKTPDEIKRGLEWEEVDKALQKVHFDDVGVDDIRGPKTCADIKKALECCLGDVCAYHCDECPYADDGADVDDGCGDNGVRLFDDTMAYIRQLEAERDALMHWAKGRCDTCAHNDDCVKHDPDPEGYIMHWYDDCEIWEWRGLPEPPKGDEHG